MSGNSPARGPLLTSITQVVAQSASWLSGACTERFNKLRLMGCLLTLAAVLPGCEADYYAWIDDFQDDHSDVKFVVAHASPYDLNDDLADRIASCQPTQFNPIDQYEQERRGMTTTTRFVRETHFVLPAPGGGCEFHTFRYSSTSSSGLGCSSDSSTSTYEICSGGFGVDCEVIERSES